MSFKVKLHSYGGAQAEEFKKTDSNKIGNFHTNNNNKYEYQFSENVDPDVKKNPNKWFNEKEFADIIESITGLEINLKTDANQIFKTTDNGRTGTIHLNLSDTKLLEALINLKDIKKNINLQEQQKLEVKKQARQAVQEAQLRAEAAEAAAARANEQIAQVKAKAAQAAQAAQEAQEAQEAQIRTKADKQQIKCMNERRKLKAALKEIKPVSVSEGEGDLILSLDFDNLNQFGGSKTMAVKTDSDKPIDIKDKEGKTYRAYVGSVGSEFINMTENETKLNEAKTAVKQAQEAQEALVQTTNKRIVEQVKAINKLQEQLAAAQEEAKVAGKQAQQAQQEAQVQQKVQVQAEATYKAQQAVLQEDRQNLKKKKNIVNTLRETFEKKEQDLKKREQDLKKKEQDLKKLKKKDNKALQAQINALQAAHDIEISDAVEKQTEQSHQLLKTQKKTIENLNTTVKSKDDELVNLYKKIEKLEEASKKELEEPRRKS